MHTLYKATFSDTVISERHTARDIHSNIIQKSNSGMSASTNVHFVCGQKQIAPGCSQYLQYSRMHTRVLRVKIYTAARACFSVHSGIQCQLIRGRPAPV